MVCASLPVVLVKLPLKKKVYRESVKATTTQLNSVNYGKEEEQEEEISSYFPTVLPF